MTMIRFAFVVLEDFGLNRSFQLVTKSKYNDALSTLLEPVVCQKLTISEYHRWVHELWSLIELIRKRWWAFSSFQLRPELSLLMHSKNTVDCKVSRNRSSISRFHPPLTDSWVQALPSEWLRILLI